MASEIPIYLEDTLSRTTEQLLAHFREIRKINIVPTQDTSAPRLVVQSILSQLESLSSILSSLGRTREAETLQDVHALSMLSADFGGLGLSPSTPLSSHEEASVLFLVSAWLESLNSADRAKSPPKPLSLRPAGRRGMTLSEKILAAHDVERRGVLKPGDMVRVDIDWVMASELSWAGMEREYDVLGKPGIFRNDRFWIVGDHVVDPRIKDNPTVKEMVAGIERARDDFKMTEYQGTNYTIMHTEFYRERAQPGMIVIGSDSHTCSAGSVGALAIGLGASDVTIPLITGQTWFKVPESVNIRLINSLSPGIGGKDTILYILQQLKRNTVAADRVVEFTGPGLQHLSCDARFAISNMCAEFGAITGIFAPDQVTYDFISRRRLSRHKKTGTYFRPDDDAQYAETHVIDLAKVESFVALYPKPDDVVPVSTVAGKQLDGCFIGACTTTEEDLVIGAMVLEIGLRKGLVPVKDGKRRVVPGSLPIVNRLESLGFLEIYKKAGFTVGVPGCSYCVGMGADRAGEGEVWLSSQNRNFENRMGKGSIGSLGSAATVAASSFSMEITDPKPYLDEIDRDRLREILGYSPKDTARNGPTYVEPSEDSTEEPSNAVSNGNGTGSVSVGNIPISESDTPIANSASEGIRRGKVQRLGDFIDTDALAPAEFLTTCFTPEELGPHCLEHTHPQFYSRAKEGYNIVVAGNAFGCGSSRENAVGALLGCGVVCVIAKSFAFIYARNQPNLGLLGIVISDDSFYDAAKDGVEVMVDLDRCMVGVQGVEKEWGFQLGPMERELIEVGGLNSAFKKFGKTLFNVMCAPKGSVKSLSQKDESCGTVGELQW